MAKRKVQQQSLANAAPARLVSNELVDELRSLIAETRSGVSQAVNDAMVNLYWQVGTRIRTEILKNQRADYGKQICSTLSIKLTAEFGKGFSHPNLAKMLVFAELFPDPQILLTLSRKLSWSHFVELLRLRDELKREFYAEMCRVEDWSVRMLRDKINGMLYERTALSRKPEELAKQEIADLRDDDKLTPGLVFRDPYFLDFLGLKDTYTETDLERAILRELESFILELGTGFAFVGRQHRITIDDEDFYIDLLFYHRKLRRLVVIDLKLGKFKASYKGQVELYLRWLEKHEMQEGEETPVGLILCADKSNEQIELLRLDESGIHVATYLTELPPIDLLRARLHRAVADAKRLLNAQTNTK